MKTCTKCGVEKEDGEFYRRSNGNLRKDCKKCCEARSREWAEHNPEKVAEAKRRWREDHIEQDRACKRVYLANNRGRRLATQRRYRQDNPDSCRLSTRAWKYGLTREQLDALIAGANGVCDLCGQPSKWQLHIDHDHSTGRVRGVLCRDCNIGLGNFRDSIDTLELAIVYLKQRKEGGVGGIAITTSDFSLDKQDTFGIRLQT